LNYGTCHVQAIVLGKVLCPGNVDVRNLGKPFNFLMDSEISSMAYTGRIPQCNDFHNFRAMGMCGF
jgi:hypothetical protein